MKNPDNIRSILIYLILLFLSFSANSQENLTRSNQQKEQFVNKIMDLSNRNYTELSKLLENKDVYIEDRLIEIALDNRQGERPQRRAVWALGIIGSDKIVHLFINSIKDEKLDVYARYDMAKVFSDWNLERTIKPLINVFNNKDVHTIVRRELANTFGKINKPLTIEPLINALSEDDQNVREGVCYALGKIGSEKCINVLTDLLKDKNINIRRTANSALRELRPDLKIDLILSSIDDDWIYFSEHAIIELSSLGESVVEELHNEIKDKDDFFRWQLLRVLSRIKSVKSTNLFLELLSDKNENIINECAVGLAGIKSEELVNRLIDILKSDNHEIKETVIWILGEISSERAVKSLKKLSRSKNNKLKTAAILALDKTNNKEQNIKPLEYQPVYYEGKINYPVYPDLNENKPDIPSPLYSKNNVEYIVGLSKNNKYALIPVTLEEITRQDKEWWEKGRQLYADFSDFPSLSKTGLHSDTELDFTKSITGRSISEINYLARPDRSSGAGFIAIDEDIISVIKGDNRLIRKMGLIQENIIRPLFHFWNMVVEGMNNNHSKNDSIMMKGLFYNNHFINTTAAGRGYQESIFDDEVQGNFHLEIWRDPTSNEISYLNEHYSHLTKKEMTDLKKKLFFVHTGEMALYYARWYGFYEGHTDYRADPISIACIFGIKSLEEIDKSLGGKLYDALNEHHISTN